jgi:hypothetical protein
MLFYFQRINWILSSNGRNTSDDPAEIKIRGYIEQHGSQRIRGGVGFPDACNTMFQGLTADAALDALAEVSRRCYVVPSSMLFGARVVNFIHDEIMLEVREEQADEAARELEHVMVEVYQRWTPDVRITAGATLMRRWSKKAKRREQNSVLVPWEDWEDWQQEAA